MNDPHFDSIARELAAKWTRRSILGTAATTCAGGIFAAVLAETVKHQATAQVATPAGTPATPLPQPATPVGTPATPIQPPATYTRPNLHGLDPFGPELQSYALGIQRLSLVDEFDPLSFLYQANIHGSPTAPLQLLWSTCQHFSIDFWPWHRMYLYWFERKIREASGDPTFSLPFWDYSNPAQRVLPEPFRDVTSPLYVSQRDPGVNIGLPPVGIDSIFDHCGGFEQTEFDFASNWLEGTPHGNVHVWVGGAVGPLGSPGWMGSFNFAGRDPIFWCHHSNIDRLWESWLNQGGGRSNPTDPVWQNTEWSFFDENGTLVTMAHTDVEDLVGQLGYQYEYLATCEQLEPVSGGGPGEAIPEGTPGPVVVLGGRFAKEPIELGSEALTVPVDMAAEVPGFAARTTVLTLEGVRGEGVPGVGYEVYINLPQRETPDFRSPYYVGNINMFGIQTWDMPEGEHDQRATAQRFNISGNIDALDARGEWTGAVQVTFVPIDLASPATTEPGTPEAAGEALAPPASPAPPEPPLGPWVSIASIAVTAE
jgi:tyrosinase